MSDVAADAASLLAADATDVLAADTTDVLSAAKAADSVFCPARVLMAKNGACQNHGFGNDSISYGSKWSQPCQARRAIDMRHTFAEISQQRQ